MIAIATLYETQPPYVEEKIVDNFIVSSQTLKVSSAFVTIRSNITYWA